MRNLKLVLAAAASVMAISGTANAASIIRADVTGPTGTIWTTANTGNYTLFLQNDNTSPYINTNVSGINIGLNPTGKVSDLLAGEGFVPGQSVNSDPLYTLTLTLDNGAKLVGTYAPSTNVFLTSTSAVDGGQSYAITNFSYNRFRGDIVSANVGTPGGDPFDYNGNFTVSAVPEAATWMMMIAGFGMIGFAMRKRSSVKTTVRFA